MRFSAHIGAACIKQSRSFLDLAQKLKMEVTDLMRQCNGQTPPSKALVKGLAKELDIDESADDRVRAPSIWPHRMAATSRAYRSKSFDDVLAEVITLFT
jgi:transcriptional regulator with XRE-family HTH domain